MQERFAILRVLNDNVDLGSCKCLLRGVYEGRIHTKRFSMRGRIVEQTSKVSIDLSAEFLALIHGEPPNSNHPVITFDFTTNFKNGDIVEVPFNDRTRDTVTPF